MRRLVFTSIGALAALALARPAAAQDTTRVEGGVRVGISYNLGERPGLVVVPGSGIDSVRTIVRRDLDYSDRFSMIAVGDPGHGTGSAAPAGPLNYGLYKALGAEFALELIDDGGKVTARLHDVGRSVMANQQSVTLPPATDANFRLAVHVLSDEVARWATGMPGIAATRLLFVQNGRIWMVDSDGMTPRALTPDGLTSLSPAWSPDGRRMAFTKLVQGKGGVFLYTLGSGEVTQLAGTETGLNITPMFAPDGAHLAYARSDEKGTDIFVASLGERGSQRLTAGRFADNLSPTYSPDGRRIAFVSTRAGPPQLYVMAADGTDQELFAPFDFGVTGPSYAPEWSPDGTSVVFHREVSGTPQIFVLTVAGQKLRQITSQGRNEDATWAPDGRHLCFVSDRTGARQLWIIDAETGRNRQLVSPGWARLPAWSRRLAGAAVVAPKP
ncbi:MAG TPA: LpqB family beta-propeller domain-containing protein [Gemmatimonadales bacterium]|nr:LpqB family beta-propeller domain-containing protein [Gemmatimonadales bacterium]